MSDQKADRICFSDGLRHLRIDVENDRPSRGPVTLQIEAGDLQSLAITLQPLARLNRLWRSKVFPTAMFGTSAQTTKAAVLLRVFDGLQAGASHREIAAAIFGTKWAESEWRKRSDFLRLRVQRLSRLARSFGKPGAYRKVLP